LIFNFLEALELLAKIWKTLEYEILWTEFGIFKGLCGPSRYKKVKIAVFAK
jgi:hypothetical protein